MGSEPLRVAVVILHVSLLWQADAEISLVRVRSPFLLIEIESLSSLRSNRHLSYNLKTRKTRRLPWRCNKVACDTSTRWEAVSPASRFTNPWTSYVVALGGKTSAVLVCPSFSQPWYKKSAIHVYINFFQPLVTQREVLPQDGRVVSLS